MIGLNFILLLLLVAGHTELLVAMVNRVHARPVPCGSLRRLRHLHDLLIPVFPVVLFWFVGLRGPGLLTGGEWADLSPFWWPYLALCAVGTLGLVTSVLRWGFRRLPRQQLSNHTRIVDVEADLGYQPLGDGPFQFLARVPGNQIFQVEVSEKEYRLPRLPSECDGLSILHLSDLHLIGTLDRPFFERIADLSAEQQPDLIVLTGDVLDRQELAAWLPHILGGLSAPMGCYFILGNHDWYLDPDAIRQCLTGLGWQDTAGVSRLVNWRGHDFILAGTERPWMGEHPEFPATPADAFRILLSHTPDHVDWAVRQRVDLMLSGHNHGGQVVLPLIGPVYAPSRYGVRYAAGAYWHDPTLLYVTRGLSGRHPLRLNCRPELTKLVLRSAG